jgi:outer membrane protein assembly factor BamB
MPTVRSTDPADGAGAAKHVLVRRLSALAWLRAAVSVALLTACWDNRITDPSGNTTGGTGQSVAVRWRVPTQTVEPLLARDAVSLSGAIVVAAGRELVAYDTVAGALRWRRTVSADVSDLVAGQAGQLLVSAGDSVLVADPADGSVRAAFSSGLPARTRGYFAGPEHLFALSGEVRLVNASARVSEPLFSVVPRGREHRLSRSGDTLFAVTTGGGAFVDSLVVSAFVAQSGALLWRTPTDLALLDFLDFSSTQPPVADDSLVVVATGGELLTYRRRTGAPLWRRSSFLGLFGSNRPAVSAGRVYAVDGPSLLALANGQLGWSVAAFSGPIRDASGRTYLCGAQVASVSSDLIVADRATGANARGLATAPGTVSAFASTVQANATLYLHGVRELVAVRCVP